MLFFIGLGLCNEDDITEAGLAAVRTCDLIFLEAYTSVLGVDRERLERKYGKPIILAERELVEQRAEKEILEPARTKNVALLVVGDPFGATTHSDLHWRAIEMGITVRGALLANHARLSRTAC